MSEADPPIDPSSPTKSTDDDAASRVPPFSRHRLQRELAFDGAIRTVGVGAMFLAFFVLLSVGLGGSTLTVALALGIVLGWVALSAVGAKVAQALPGLPLLIENHPAAGEAKLAGLLKKRALPRGIRMMLMFRLAMLRHRQQHFAESSAIAQTLLTTPRPGPAGQHRGHLLLILLEARLELRDAAGAWLALVELAHTPLGLTEALQRMALRTRYELLVGEHAQTLAGIDQKSRLAELMPAPQCGAFHAMLAAAAKRSGRDDWFDHLWPRVQLLCTETEISHLRESGMI